MAVTIQPPAALATPERTEATRTRATAADAPTIAWKSCDNEGLRDMGAECGLLSVPLDYARPDGKQVQLAISRVKHLTPDAQYQGIMLTNPGGPGGSGLGLSTLGMQVPGDGGDPYDWIGFDPRGVGSSKPSLSCIPEYFKGPRPEYVPWKMRLETVWLSRSKSYANACRKAGRELLEHLTTADSAKDMDRIRIALGQEQINYYGFSYGTYLGQVYSTLFPQRVRRMVLDSNVDPRNVWYQANLDQDIAFQRNIRIWFGWLAKYDGVYHLGKTAAEVEVRYYVEQGKLREQPAGGLVGPDEWTDIFLYAGYYEMLWVPLASVLARWVNERNTDPLLAAYRDFVEPDDDNGFAIYNAVQCSDVQWPKSWARWRRDNWQTFLIAPFATWGNAWFNAPCLYWPAKASTSVNVDGSQVDSVLLVGQTLDAATPFEGSIEVRRRFPNASLIAVPGGTTHAGTLRGDTCTDDLIAGYLLRGERPVRKAGDEPDAACQPPAQPDPTTDGPNTTSTRPLTRIR